MSALTSPELLGHIDASVDMPRPLLVVGFSGGGDSLALLALLARSGATVRALHVNHGLQPQAPYWVKRCEALCETLSVPLTVLDVQVETRGGSVEATARSARYAAVADWLPAGAVFLTAHHRHDQAETFLMAALRGAGPAGLGAMPLMRPLGAGWHLRPVLDVPRERLQAVLTDSGFEAIDDPMNHDPRYERAWVRNTVWPVLTQGRSGDPAAVFARSARWCGESDGLLAELAAIDLGSGLDAPVLPLARLHGLSDARARNLLRQWLRRRIAHLPGERRVGAFLHAVLTAGEDRMPALTLAQGRLCRYRAAIHWVPDAEPLPATGVAWTLSGPLVLPGGVLEARWVAGQGADAQRLAGARVTVRPRLGGERFHPAGRVHGQTLKKLMQAAGWPPWQRQRVPLIYADDALVAVPGLGVAADWVAADGKGLAFCWLDDGQAGGASGII